MAYASGLSAQIGYGVESVYGTRIVPTIFPEFLSESLKCNAGRIESKALRAGTRVQRTDRWAKGPRDVGGTTVHELQSKGLGTLLKHALGANATSQPAVGTDPTVYEHKSTLATPTGLGMTIQVGRPDNAGTVRPWDYLGCKVASFKLAGEVGGIPTLELTWFGTDESTAQTLATAGYATGLEVLNWTGTTVTIGGTAYVCQKVTVTGTHGMKTDRFNLGSTNRSEPIANAFSVFGVEIESEYLDNTAYAHIAAGDTVAIVSKFTGSIISTTYAYALEVTLPAVRIDGETPNVAGTDLVSQPIKGTALDDSGADGAVKMVYRTTDATV